MTDLLAISVLPVSLTLITFLAGQKLQKKFRSPLLNPILISVILVLIFLSFTGLPVADYKAGMGTLSWLLTPATICLAVPMYEQFQILKKNLPMILAGVAAGAVSCLIMVAGFGILVNFESILTISLMPKSITTAIGVALSEMMGGMPGVTTAAIVFTGIFASIMGPAFCRLFRLTDEVARGVAFGTAGHVIGTSKANELSPLTGAVSSLSLVVAGLLTAVVLPLFSNFI
ncbi:MAG: LrgB family protein [Oscillospiraceae bacterium]|nr:LrgB family protein [Oscillospiraceae bacterium]